MRTLNTMRPSDLIRATASMVTIIFTMPASFNRLWLLNLNISRHHWGLWRRIPSLPQAEHVCPPPPKPGSQAAPPVDQHMCRILTTPVRYLFLGSTRYYTIFWVLIRLSHDITRYFPFGKKTHKLQESRHFWMLKYIGEYLQSTVVKYKGPWSSELGTGDPKFNNIGTKKDPGGQS